MAECWVGHLGCFDTTCTRGLFGTPKPIPCHELTILCILYL